MKAILLFISLTLATITAAQTADSLAYRYADLTYPVGGPNSKAYVVVDYGATVTGWFRKSDVLEDADGKAIKFKSPVDALNWMSLRGWELVQSYQTNENSGLANLTYMHFIMRRKEATSK